MPYCQKCGHRLKQNENYCPMCGATVVIDEEDYRDTHSYDEDYRDTHSYEDNDGTVHDLSQNRLKQNDSSRSLGVVILIFMWIGVLSILFDAFTFLMLTDVISTLDPEITGATTAFFNVNYIILGFLPILWKIPLTIAAHIYVKKRRNFPTWFAVVSLLFCNLIAGFLMFFYKPAGEDF